MASTRTFILVFDKRPSFEEILIKFDQLENYEVEARPFDHGITLIDLKDNTDVSIYYRNPEEAQNSIVRFREEDYEYLYVHMDEVIPEIANVALEILYGLGGKDFDR